jgi:hypothetical protein
MSESASFKSEFPIEINVGQKVPDYDGSMAVPAGGKADSKKQKTKTSYPRFTVDGGADLAKIPKDGYALVKLHRTNLSMGEKGKYGESRPGGKEGASVELEVRELCLPEQAAGDVKDAFAAFAAKKGVDTEGAAPSGDDADEDTLETPPAGGGDEETEEEPT